MKKKIYIDLREELLEEQKKQVKKKLEKYNERNVKFTKISKYLFDVFVALLVVYELFLSIDPNMKGPGVDIIHAVLTYIACLIGIVFWAFLIKEQKTKIQLFEIGQIPKICKQKITGTIELFSESEIRKIVNDRINEILLEDSTIFHKNMYLIEKFCENTSYNIDIEVKKKLIVEIDDKIKKCWSNNLTSFFKSKNSNFHHKDIDELILNIISTYENENLPNNINELVVNDFIDKIRKNKRDEALNQISENIPAVMLQFLILLTFTISNALISGVNDWVHSYKIHIMIIVLLFTAIMYFTYINQNGKKPNKLFNNSFVKAGIPLAFLMITMLTLFVYLFLSIGYMPQAHTIALYIVVVLLCIVPVIWGIVSFFLDKRLYKLFL